MTARRYTDNAPVATLTASIGSTDTSITVSSLSGFPTSFPYFATLDLGTSSAEVVQVTGATGSTATVVRNVNGLGSFSHTGTSGTFTHTVVAQDLQEANDHINASTGVHGLASGVGVVGTTTVQTLSGKTLTAPTINNGTQNSPTINTPTISSPTVTGTATVATSHVTGNETVGGTLGVTGNATFGGTVAASGQVTGPSGILPNECFQMSPPPTTCVGNGANNLGVNSANGTSPDYNTLGIVGQVSGSYTAFFDLPIPAGKGGRYRISGQVKTNQNIGRLNAGISKNGAIGNYILSSSVQADSTGDTCCVFGPKMVTLAAGDVLRLYANPEAVGVTDNNSTLADSFILIERIA